MKTKRLIIILLMILLSPECFAFSFGSSNFGDTSATRSYVKYSPQRYNYNNQFMRQKKNYIYSPQQAKYYGYRPVQQQQQNMPVYGYDRTYSQNYSYTRYGR